MISKFIDVAKINGVEARIVNDINFLRDLGLDASKNFDKAGDYGFLIALAGVCESASSLVNIADRTKLRTILSSKILYIVIRSVNIVNTLLEGYMKAKSKTMDEYILVISGESKTADIEKTLVSGVQGPEKIIFVIL